MKKDPDMGKSEPRIRKQAAEVKSGDKTGAKIKNKGIWKRFFHMLAVAKLPWVVLIIYIAANVIEGIILVRVPEYSANFFAGDANIQSVTMFIVMELVVTVVSQVVLYISYHLRARMNCNLRNALWGKILRLKPKYFDKVSANTLISRITVDSESVNEFLMDIILDLAFQVYVLVLTILEMSSVSITAGLILLAFTPISILYAFIVGRIGMKFNNSLKLKMSDMTAYLSDLIACLPLIKAFNRQSYERRRGKRVIDDYYNANKKIVFLDYIKAVLGTVVGMGPEIAIIVIGIQLLGNDTFTPEMWYAFYLYAGTFIAFVNRLGGLWQTSKGVQGSLNKVSDIIYEEEESLDAYVNEIIESGDIQFDGVSFAYEKNNIVLDNASFTIPRGKNTAVIGYSGSGKSTILKLLERIYEPTEGRILSGESDLKCRSLQAWRQNIAYVSQSTPLLSGTIRDNIIYGINREVSEEEITEAVTLAGAAKFIEECPDGYDYEVGQFGTRLSGGQRQKISIARAILTGADILILDEPTASLDMISANEIMQTVEGLRGKRTVILVTHDGKALKCADHLIVVNKNHTVEQGSADRLVLSNDFAQRLVRA